MSCSFDGAAARVELVGVGRANFLRRQAFTEGVADRADLQTASVGPLKPPVVGLSLNSTTWFDPIDVGGQDEDYDAIYQIDQSKLTVRIHDGEHGGVYRGAIDGAPECGSAGCPIRWQKGQDIVVVLHLAAGVQTPRLTGDFPFVIPGPGASSTDSLKRVIARDASGSSSCDEGVQIVKHKDVVWSGAADATVHIRGGLKAAVDGIKFVLDSTNPLQESAQTAPPTSASADLPAAPATSPSASANPATSNVGGGSTSHPDLGVVTLIAGFVAIVGVVAVSLKARQHRRGRALDRVLQFGLTLGLAVGGALICFGTLHSTGLVHTQSAELTGAAAGAVVLLIIGLQFIGKGTVVGLDPVPAMAMAAPRPKPEVGTLVVTVLDPESQAVTDGEIRMDDGSAPQPINKYGMVTFTNVEHGKHTITISAPGFDSLTSTTEDRSITLRLVRRRVAASAPTGPFSLTVKVVTESGEPVTSGSLRLVLETLQPPVQLGPDGTVYFQAIPLKHWGQRVQLVLDSKKWKLKEDAIAVNTLLVAVEAESRSSGKAA